MQFRIAGIPYTVEFKPDLMSDMEALGYVRFETQSIYIDPALPPERMSQTIVHELTHAVLYEAGYTEHDEEMADRIGKALWQMLIDSSPEAFERLRDLADGTSTFE